MALSSPDSVQSGSESIASGDGTTINITISAVTVADSIVMYTIRNADTAGRLYRHIFNASLTSTTNLRLTRNASSFATAIVVEWTVIEFASGEVTIQTGEVDSTSATENITISAVVLADTFPIFGLETSANAFFRNVIFYGEFTSTTNLRLNYNTAPTTGQSVVQYQVVESTDFSVQEATISFTSGDATESKTSTISAVTLANTFIINAGLTVSDDFNQNRHFMRFKLNDTTTVQADRSLAGTEPALTGQFYVIEVSDGQVVESFDSTILDTDTAPTTQPSWTALSTSLTAIMNGGPWGNKRGDNTNDDLPEDDAITIKLDAGADGATITRTGVDGERKTTGYAVDWTVAAAGGRIMSSMTNHGGLAGYGGIAGQGGGLAG